MTRDSGPYEDRDVDAELVRDALSFYRERDGVEPFEAPGAHLDGLDDAGEWFSRSWLTEVDEP